MIQTFTAGKYIEQYKYKSFLPAKINSGINWVSESNLNLSRTVENNLKELSSEFSKQDRIEKFKNIFTLKEGLASAHLDGITTSLTESLLPLEKIIPERRNDWIDTQNLISAYNYAYEQMNELPISMRLLKELHEIILDGPKGKKKSPGEKRSTQNWVGGKSLKDAIYIPPHPDDLPDLISDLEKFIHNDYILIPDLVRIAIVHYQLFIIHPFVDANGRINRLLTLLMLIDRNLADFPFFIMSDILEFYTKNYYEYLVNIPFSNDINNWIEFFLLRVKDAVEKTRHLFESLLEVENEYHDDLPGDEQLLKLIFQKPVIGISELQAYIDTTVYSLEHLITPGHIAELETGDEERYYSFKYLLDVMKK